ncbi:MAG: hypothetical protein FWF07_03170 [Methanomassiliicoccaceae archaeon]|nr:hypothetical protein [Methanomassiliicoccaceae archaeon]
MGPDNTVLSLGIIILLVALLAITFVVHGYVGAKYNLRGKLTGQSRKESTTFLDDGEDEKKCEICYGKIDKDPIAMCPCGKIFHEACAKPTGSCPYCGVRYEEMEVREPEMKRCPVCGRFLKGNICSCGAVIPKRDNTFICKCGGVVDVDKPVCRKCGAVYESAVMKVFREQK